MSKYWTEKQDGVDDVSAGAFNDAFDMIAGDIENLQKSIEDVGGLDKNSITTEMLKDKIITVPKLSDAVVSRYENLFDSNSVTVGGTDLRITIDGLETDGIYSFNAPVKLISSGGTQLSPTEIFENHYVVEGTQIRNNSVLIAFSTTQDYSKFMFVKGGNLPIRYIPYGYPQTINSNLTGDIYHNAQYGTQNISSPLNRNGLIFYLQPNRIYSVDLGETSTFYLPELAENEYAQILVQANVTVAHYANFGTQFFFNSEVPYLEVGKYNLIWEWDGTNWYAGAISKGQGESV